MITAWKKAWQDLPQAGLVAASAQQHSSDIRIPRIFKWLVALEVLVHEMRQRECSDWKDKIMAPLAFAMKYAPTSGYGQLEGRIKDLLDYLKSTDELY